MVCGGPDQTCEVCRHNMGMPLDVAAGTSINGWTWDIADQKWWRRDEHDYVIYADDTYPKSWDYRLGMFVPEPLAKIDTFSGTKCKPLQPLPPGPVQVYPSPAPTAPADPNPLRVWQPELGHGVLAHVRPGRAG